MYLHDWKCFDDMANDFELPDSVKNDLMQNATILLASYTYEDYSGTAYVLYDQDGKLYEVFGSHCSCYGLEDQWIPEETFIEALKYRLECGYVDSEFKHEYAQVLNSISKGTTNE